jgi:hypothetical protein
VFGAPISSALYSILIRGTRRRKAFRALSWGPVDVINRQGNDIRTRPDDEESMCFFFSIPRDRFLLDRSRWTRTAETVVTAART